jgi:Zn-dependent peptidase ImmA (M78 family)
LNSDLALIQLSLRYKWDDHFWFTFFHEAGHVLLHGKREVFLEESEAAPEQQKEDEANRFASEFLIPRATMRAFTTRTVYSYADVEAFAARIGIAPGIVVGQLQNRGQLPHSHLNRLKRKFVWKHEAP